jgi:hypothetical protein
MRWNPCVCVREREREKERERVREGGLQNQVQESRQPELNLEVLGRSAEFPLVDGGVSTLDYGHI